MPGRVITPFQSNHLDHLFSGHSRQTTNDINREIWLIIKSYSDVGSRGRALAKKHGCSPARSNEAWLAFRGYIRAAENYWTAAETTPWQTSPLLYYYCLLNLVKALLVLKDPDMPRRISHGLSFLPTKRRSAFSKQYVSAPDYGRRKDVFKDDVDTVYRSFQWQFTGKLGPTKINIVNALAYCYDIGEQYELSFGPARSVPFQYRIVSDSSHTWSLLAIQNSANLESYPSIFRQFLRDYEKVDIPPAVPQYLRDAFGLRLHAWQGYSFYENRNKTALNPSSWLDYSSDPHNLFGERLGMNVIDDSNSGFLYLPRNTRDGQIMTEELAIYSVFFFLSSLVRYQPEYIDGLSGQKAGWVIESFVKTCPSKFLRRYICLLEKQISVVSHV